jgi:hypothetical protein
VIGSVMALLRQAGTASTDCNTHSRKLGTLCSLGAYLITCSGIGKTRTATSLRFVQSPEMIDMHLSSHLTYSIHGPIELGSVTLSKGCLSCHFRLLQGSFLSSVVALGEEVIQTSRQSRYRIARFDDLHREV